jgi:ParB-like chromosome segregation protein Spo0J
MVPLSSLHLTKSSRGLSIQEPEKIARIAEDIKTNGFGRNQPILITKDSAILDGNSRYQTALKAGIRTVPVAVKKFENKNEALIYEYELQLNRRNLTDSDFPVKTI